MKRTAIALAFTAGFAAPALAADEMKNDVSCQEYMDMGSEDRMTAIEAMHEERMESATASSSSSSSASSDGELTSEDLSASAEAACVANPHMTVGEAMMRPDK
ncbi:hypothetical protein G5B40_19115 [Pikeienuella piscinae]|uniref:Uncharacterized protein n=1 Tax=Pikeienuella piscinae TaxID=2748098 RepID=A0A7M3T5T4_9RHOB|nr:hypothetical protein [Pikeienuella piscinae]QIE57365.1 hypothetical protein G5B40_19115 [Pikeienuella piscinae]